MTAAQAESARAREKMREDGGRGIRDEIKRAEFLARKTDAYACVRPWHV